MLVISRKQNEAIVVNGNIEIEVVEIRGDKVRIGIRVPPEMAVHRREVFEALQRMDDAPARAGADSVRPQAARPPESIRLAPRHAQLLDRLRDQLRPAGDEGPGRELVLEVILDAVIENESTLTAATDLTSLETLVRDGRGVKPKPAPADEGSTAPGAIG